MYLLGFFIFINIFFVFTIALYKSKGKVIYSLHLILKDTLADILKTLPSYALAILIISLMIYLCPFYSKLLTAFILVKLSHLIRKILVSYNPQTLKLILKEFLDLMIKLFSLHGLFSGFNFTD